ncbi:MAG: hypothetical protein AAGI11_22410 [Pseudomonadota bacterium]
MPQVTPSALEDLKQENHSFYERLNALLDLCGVVAMGAGRQSWIAGQGKVTPLAVKGWEQGRKVREGNIQTLAASIVADLPVACSTEEVTSYLRGDRPDIHVSLELQKLGLSMPTQAWFLNLLNEEMAAQGLIPTDPALFRTWSSAAIRTARYYVAACNDAERPNPDDARIRRVMGHYVGLCIEGAIEPGTF